MGKTVKIHYTNEMLELKVDDRNFEFLKGWLESSNASDYSIKIGDVTYCLYNKNINYYTIE